MATIGYWEPNRGSSGILGNPIVGTSLPAQNATWRRGNFLVRSTTGTITNPSPNGAFSTIAGPALPSGIFLANSSSSFTLGPVTVVGHTSAGAPAATYYIFLTYAVSTSEGAIGPEAIVSCAAGIVPGITVTSVGSPSTSTGTWTYAGVYSGTEVRQNASITTFGTEFDLSSPLTNNVGAAQAATNVSGNILGMAQNFDTSTYFSGTGGSSAVNENSLFGATMDIPALTPQEVNLAYFDKLQFETIEMNLVQPFFLSMIGNQQVGLLLDPTTGVHVADTSQSNKIGTIVGQAVGAQITSQGGITGLLNYGNIGDSGARVVVQFLSTVII